MDITVVARVREKDAERPVAMVQKMEGDKRMLTILGVPGQIDLVASKVALVDIRDAITRHLEQEGEEQPATHCH
ncbi:MAG: hypothetical protein AB1405_03595 [Bdellovibrionota bacterium]